MRSISARKKRASSAQAAGSAGPPSRVGRSRYGLQSAAGSDDLLVILYDAFAAAEDDSSHALYLATSCTDARWPKNWATWHRDNWAVYREAPFITWGNVWFNAPCLHWPARAGEPVAISGRGLPPVLLFQSSKDAATPYAGAVEMHRLLPSSRLIVEEGGGNHGVSLSGNECLDGHLAAYLADGTVPPSRRGPDAVCAPLPDPEPPTATLRMSRPELPEIRVRR
jgi:pimeloyl-ACP methyl ester carboxylesterase